MDRRAEKVTIGHQQILQGPNKKKDTVTMHATFFHVHVYKGVHTCVCACIPVFLLSEQYLFWNIIRPTYQSGVVTGSRSELQMYKAATVNVI